MSNLVDVKNVQMIGEHLADPAKAFYNIVFAGNLVAFKDTAFLTEFCDKYKNEKLSKNINEGDHMLLSCADGTVMTKVAIVNEELTLMVAAYAIIP